jgi:hypothetical protein
MANNLNIPDLTRWRATALLQTVWRLGAAQKHWTVLDSERPKTGGHSIKFVIFAVPPLPQLALETHELKLWQNDYFLWVKELSPWERQEWDAFLNLRRPPSLYAWKTSKGRLERDLSKLNQTQHDLAIRLIGLCKEVRQEVMA